MTVSAPPSPAPDFVARWRDVVALHPGREALCDGERTLTYAEADAIAAAAAAALRAAGAGPERLVGLRFGRPLDYVLGALATLRAGAAFLVHPPGADPAASPAGLWLARGGDPPRPGPAPVVDLSACERAEGSEAGPSGGLVDPRQLAYVLFTSGSSGNPKGAMATRGGLGALCAAVGERLSLTAADRWMQLAAPSFDVFLEETLPVLAAGGTAVCRPRLDALDFPAVQHALERSGATVVEMTTQYWLEYRRWLEAAGRTPPAALRVLVVGGERMDARAYRAWQARFATPLVHVYGITETTVSSTMFHGRLGPGEHDVPVGRPLANTVLRLAGAGPGVEAEIGLAGDCVGRGYLRNPARTAERFLPDPAGPPGSRVFATGDHGLVNARGELVFRARRDDRVKVRGHRVRLSTVERALESLAAVARAVVMPDPQLASNLIAFVVHAGGGGAARQLLGAERAALCAGLRGALPAWAVPGRIFALGELPQNVNGKVDKAALHRLARAARGGAPPEAAAQAPVAIPELVVRAFRTVLQASDLQPDDNFFDFGGDSLLALSLASELAGASGAPLSAAVVFDAPTPRALAGHISARLSAQAARAEAA